MNIYHDFLFDRIAQTFASGKTEKLVYQCIGEVGIPNGKVISFFIKYVAF